MGGRDELAGDDAELIAMVAEIQSHLADIEANLHTMAMVADMGDDDLVGGAGPADESVPSTAETVPSDIKPVSAMYSHWGPDKTDSACPKSFAATARQRAPPRPKEPRVPRELQNNHGGVAWDKVEKVLEMHQRELDKRREAYCEAMNRKVALQRKRIKQAEARRARAETRRIDKLLKNKHNAASTKPIRSAPPAQAAVPIKPYNPPMSAAYIRLQDQYRDLLKARRDKTKRYVPASQRYLPSAPTAAHELSSTEVPPPSGDGCPRQDDEEHGESDSQEGDDAAGDTLHHKDTYLAREADIVRSLFQSMPPPSGSAQPRASKEAVEMEAANARQRLAAQAKVRRMLVRADHQIARTQELMASLNLFADEASNVSDEALPDSVDDCQSTHSPHSAMSRPSRQHHQPRRKSSKGPVRNPKPHGRRRRSSTAPPSSTSSTTAHSSLPSSSPSVEVPPSLSIQQATSTPPHLFSPPPAFDAKPAPLSMQELSSTLPKIDCGPIKMWRPPYLGAPSF
eukprot:m.36984 g.36984  ORF g.36984 m.36984 type:complete len:512 (-) comp5460_c0_seq1:65-1600(-)